MRHAESIINEMTKLGVSAQAVHASFGLRLSGLDLAQSRVPRLDELLRDALDLFGLLLFSDQDLSPQQELDVVRIFNELCDPALTENDASIPGFPHIFVLSNIVGPDGAPTGFTNKAGMEWHTDGAGWPQPPLASAIYALEVPTNGGGRTHFVDGFEGYARLSDDRRAAVDEMMCRYSFAHQLGYLADVSDSEPPPDHLVNRYPDVVRPLVRVHPPTGRKALWFGVEDVVEIDDMGASASRRFLEDLAKWMASDPAIAYVHSWTEGDMCVFDNRRLLHSPSPYDYDGFRRLMHQITGRDTGYNEPRQRVLADHWSG